MKNWNDFNINFESNEDFDKIITDCPKCHHTKKNKTHQTLMLSQKENQWFCKHCGFAGDLIYGIKNLDYKKYTINELNPFLLDYEPCLHQSIIDKFQSKKISTNTLDKHNIGFLNKVYFPKTESNKPSIIFPYYKNGILVNLIYFSQNYRHSEISGEEICYGYDDIDDEHTIFVYDEIEKLTFSENGINNVIALFGGMLDSNMSDKKNDKLKILDFLANIEKRLNSIHKITLALPNNEQGLFLTDELLRRFGKARCWTVTPPEVGYTWNDFYCDYGKDKFLELLKSERAYPVSGIFDIDDVEDEFDDLYKNGFKKGVSTGYSSLDPYYTIIPGQWTVVTGIPGHGKSNFLDALITNLAIKQQWRFGIFSPENQPIQRHFASILEKKMGSPFNYGAITRISPEEKNAGKEWLKKHFSIILPDDDSSWSIDGILELAKVLVYRKGIKGLVIDPWNEIDHSRPTGATETEYISAVLTKIRKFARIHDVHVWLIAHPAKLYKEKNGKYPVPTPYDISGSAHFRNKADNAIAVWRNVGGDDQEIADIHIQKIRFKECGKVGLVSLRHEPMSNQFFDDVDQHKRKKSLENDEELKTKEFIISKFNTSKR